MSTQTIQFPQRIPQLDRGLSIHEVSMVREAILSVIDDGCTCDSGEKHPWEFYEDGTDVDAYTEDMANANRLRFADAVQKYITDRTVKL